jgi:hypothetical protein
MGLPSEIAVSIIRHQMDREQSDALLMDSMGLDLSYGKFLQGNDFNDFQAFDLHDVTFFDLDAEKVKLDP